MARTPKPRPDEIVKVFYGINSKTFKVEYVNLTRSGEISKHEAGQSFVRYQVQSNQDAMHDIMFKFGLIEVFGVDARRDQSDDTKQKIKELQAKAAEMAAKAKGM